MILNTKYYTREKLAHEFIKLSYRHTVHSYPTMQSFCYTCRADRRKPHFPQTRDEIWLNNAAAADEDGNTNCPTATAIVRRWAKCSQIIWMNIRREASVSFENIRLALDHIRQHFNVVNNFVLNKNSLKICISRNFMSFQTEINLFVIENKIFSIIYAIRYSICLHRALIQTHTHTPPCRLHIINWRYAFMCWCCCCTFIQVFARNRVSV